MRRPYVLVALGLMLAATTVAEAGTVRVSGYTRKDGTYVAPYYRSTPGSSGGSYSSPASSPSIYTPAPTPTPANSVYPAFFVGQPCGRARISMNKVCRIGTEQHKTQNFRNCTDAWENGVMDIPRSSPAFAEKLDRDHDGIACEISDMYDGTGWLYGREPDITEAASVVAAQLPAASVTSTPAPATPAPAAPQSPAFKVRGVSNYTGGPVALSVGCTVAGSLDIDLQGDASAMTFSTTTEAEDYLISVTVGEQEVFATSIMGDHVVKLPTLPSGGKITVSVRLLGENRVCPARVDISEIQFINASPSATTEPGARAPSSTAVSAATMGIVTGKTAGKYVPLSSGGKIGMVSDRAGGAQELISGGRLITFQSGVNVTPEGYTLSGVPYWKGGELMVPVGSFKFVGCAVTEDVGTFRLDCPNGERAYVVAVDGPK